MEKTVEKLSTPDGKSYWDKCGIYQKELDKLYAKLVPDSGEANTIHGEMIRSASRLFYDFCNNGNCNVVSRETVYETETKSCDECNGSGEVYADDDDENEEMKTCPECGGSGREEYEEEYDGDIVISDYYQDMIDFLDKHLINKKVIVNLLALLHNKSLEYGKYSYDNKEMKVYNELCDEVVYQCLTTENQKREIKSK